MRDPGLATYFKRTEDNEVRSGYLVRTRAPWFRQEKRNPPPFLCTYMGRGIKADRPFRFIWNKSQAIATNMYLMLYPVGALAEALENDPSLYPKVHDALLALTGDDLRDGGRVYGGGLHKIEPKELGNLSAQGILDLLPTDSVCVSQLPLGA